MSPLPPPLALRHVHTTQGKVCTDLCNTILMYSSLAECSMRQRPRPGTEICQSEPWDHRLGSQALNWSCRSCSWFWAVHRRSSGQRWFEWWFPSEPFRNKEKAILNRRTKHLLIRELKSMRSWKSIFIKKEWKCLSCMMSSSFSARCVFSPAIFSWLKQQQVQNNTLTSFQYHLICYLDWTG